MQYRILYNFRIGVACSRNLGSIQLYSNLSNIPELPEYIYRVNTQVSNGMLQQRKKRDLDADDDDGPPPPAASNPPNLLANGAAEGKKFIFDICIFHPYFIDGQEILKYLAL